MLKPISRSLLAGIVFPAIALAQGIEVPRPVKQIDVFLVAGQSNAEGAATDGAGAPTVPPGQVLQYYLGVIADANDPVGNALTGSAWPAFGTEFSRLTGHKVLIVPAAVGGTDQCAATAEGSGNWDVVGSLRAASVSALNGALTALSAVKYSPVFKGVIWSQGENDANGIQAWHITVEDYQTCLQRMIAAYRAATIGGVSYPQMPFYISETGGPSTGDTTYFQQIRAAQGAVAGSDPFTKTAFVGAVSFIARGMMCAACAGSNLHYEQSGYNEMGTILADNIVAGGL